MEVLGVALEALEVLVVEGITPAGRTQPLLATQSFRQDFADVLS